MKCVSNCVECPARLTIGEVLSFRDGDKWKDVTLRPLQGLVRSFPNEIVFVGDYPHLKDLGASSPRIFSGKTAEFLRDEFNKNDVPIRGENFITSLHCHVNKKPQMKYGKPNPKVSVLSNKDITQALKCCRPDVVAAIQAKAPKLIVPFGDVALRQILKTSGIGKNRGKLTWSEEFNCWVFPMYHPLMVELDMANLPFFQADVTQVCQFIKDKFVPKQVNESQIYRDVDSIQFILDRKNIVVGIDTETQGSDWCDPNSVVISYSISDEVGKGYNVWLNREVEDQAEATHQIFWDRTVKIEQEKGKPKNKKMPVRILLHRDPLHDKKVEELRQICLREDIKIVMMNGNYDIHRLMQLGIKREEIKNYVIDIQSAMHVLDPDNFKNASMLDIQRVLLPSRQDHKTAFGKDVDKSDMLKAAKENPERHTNYAAADTDSTLECAVIISDRLKRDPKLARYYTKLVHPVETEVLMDIERNGMLFDKARLPQVYEEVSILINRQEREIIDLIPSKVKDMHRSKGLRLSRTELLRDALFSKKGFGLKPIELTPTGEPTLGRKVLVRLRDSLEENHPARELLNLHIERGPYVKLYTTYLKGFEKAVKPDGKFHMQISKRGTGTGRTSARNPNLQQIPKRHPTIGKMIRDLIIAPPGYVLVCADQSQSELRFIAHESLDPEFCRVYRNDEDIHTATAEMLIAMQGHDPKTYSKADLKPWRQKAKAVNFGLSFGMFAKKFVSYARDEYNVRLTLEEAEAFRDAFFSKYAGLLPWHDARINEARRNGYVRSPFGAVRHTPNIHSTDFMKRIGDEHAAINSTIQGASNDYVLYGLLHAKRTGVIGNKNVSLASFVHDEAVCLCKEDYVDVFIPQLLECMQSPPVLEIFGFELAVPMKSEATFGPSLGRQVEWKPKQLIEAA